MHRPVRGDHRPAATEGLATPRFSRESPPRTVAIHPRTPRLDHQQDAPERFSEAAARLAAVEPQAHAGSTPGGGVQPPGEKTQPGLKATRWPYHGGRSAMRVCRHRPSGAARRRRGGACVHPSTGPPNPSSRSWPRRRLEECRSRDRTVHFHYRL
jgi:hypothetical protein